MIDSKSVERCTQCEPVAIRTVCVLSAHSIAVGIIRQRAEVRFKVGVTKA